MKRVFIFKTAGNNVIRGLGSEENFSHTFTEPLFANLFLKYIHTFISIGLGSEENFSHTFTEPLFANLFLKYIHTFISIGGGLCSRHEFQISP